MGHFVISPFFCAKVVELALAYEFKKKSGALHFVTLCIKYFVIPIKLLLMIQSLRKKKKCTSRLCADNISFIWKLSGVKIAMVLSPLSSQIPMWTCLC